MTEEKEVVPETNGGGSQKSDSNGEETIADETKVEEKDNEKQEAEASEKENNEIDEEDLTAAIIRQVEYYFGDLNLPRDKFLRDQVKLDDGWVPLELLKRFNRLSKLTTNLDVLEDALKKSTSGLLEVVDKKVRRNPEMPVPEMNEERRKDLQARTVYVKGFPKDISLDALLKFFKQFEEVENIIMRKYLDRRQNERLFKGSIFANFKLKEQADKFMELSKDLKYKDTPLLIMWQEEYSKQKQEEFEMRKERRDKKPKTKILDKIDFKLPSGTTLFFEDGNGKITREDIKAALLKLDDKAEIAYVDFKVGLTKGWVRFVKENAAKDYCKLLEDGKLKVGEDSVTVRVLEGEEEKAYLDKTMEEMSKRRKSQKVFKHNKGRSNFRGGNKQGKKRRREDHEDAPPAKVKADS